MEQESQKKKLLFAVFLGMILGAGVVGGVVWRLESLKAKKETARLIVAQQRADELRSLTNLRGIGHALIMYARNNGDTFPSDGSWKEELLATGMIIPEMLVSPNEDGDGISYLFIPGPNSFNSKQILAYEDLKHMDDGVHVVFADTSAMKIDYAIFEQMLETHAEILEAHARMLDWNRSIEVLRSIAQGLIIYAAKHYDQFPDHREWQEVMSNEGLWLQSDFISPLEDGDGVSYILVATKRTFDHIEIMVYEDPKHHKAGVLVAFSDAHVEIVPHEEFERMLAEQLALQGDGP